MEKLLYVVYDRIVDAAVRIVGIMMIVCILLQIFSRAFFRVPIPWTDELARFTFLWFCFLGSVMTLRHKMHLGIDYFESKMGEKFRYINRIFVQACVITFGAILLYEGVQILGIVAIQKSPILRLNMRYIYAVLPITGALYFILGIHNLIDHLRSGKGVAA